MIPKLPIIKFVQIATHDLCNADCVFCPLSESVHAKQKGRMTDETWNLIVSNLIPWRNTIKKICPYLMQEPLLDKTIFTKIQQLQRTFPQAVIEISTNGEPMTDAVVDKLIETFTGKPHEIWISHHGINEETLLHIMQINYERATGNLINLLRKSNGRLNLRIRGAGSSKAVNQVYFTREQYTRYWEALFRKHDLNRRNVTIDAFEFHDRAGNLHRTDRGANLLNKGIVREIGPGKPKFSCTRIDDWIHFMTSGDIRICCMDYHHEVKLPNINDISLLDYFYTPEFRRLQKMVTGAIESPADFICKRCTSPGG